MHKTIPSFTLCLILLLALSLFPVRIFAAEATDIADYNAAYNPTTGYEIYIYDEAQLLSPAEESDLRQSMEPITEHGNVAFVSISDNPFYSVESYAEDYGYSHFGNESYTLFIIDMDHRSICVYSDGEIYKTITKAYAHTITDNVYTYASDADYYACAYHAFDQINTLLAGKRIAQPMKYISNALLSIILALLINYFFVMTVSRSKKASDSQLLSGTRNNIEILNPRANFLHQTKRYSPQNSSSSGARSRSGGGSRGGGSRGGGGGGSHRF